MKPASRSRWLALAAGAAIYATVFATTTCAQTPAPDTVVAITARIAAREVQEVQNLEHYSPRIETYIQEMGPDPDLLMRPVKDHYILGRLDLTHGIHDVQFSDGAAKPNASHFSLAEMFQLQFVPDGFAAMLSPDTRHLDAAHYKFTYQGQEFLGDVRCLRFDVQPLTKTTAFVGRIWVEDRSDTIVRFDGTFIPQRTGRHRNFHFDSWRMNLNGDLWLPAAIYVEQSDVGSGSEQMPMLKAETRFWGYDRKTGGDPSELTDIQVDQGAPVTDSSDTNHDLTPLQMQRAWERKAEDNILLRLERAGLLAPPGEVDQVLQTVVNNLEVTNNLTPDPEVRCRVLLTTPLESLAVGHTIVLSRGLIDVLPDEASLAMELAHELGHIALNQKLDTRYAFDDRMMFTDDQVFAALRLQRTPQEEAAADAKGLELLRNSPYRSQLASAGLFLEAMQRETRALPNLLSPELGNAMVLNGRVQRMKALLADAPELQPRDIKQVPALPLAGRVRLDPWSDTLTLTHPRGTAMASASDKLTFEITPYEPYLTRATVASQAASAGAGN